MLQVPLKETSPTSTVSSLNYIFVAAATWILLFGYFFLQLTGQKPHYFIFIGISLFLFFLNVTGDIIRLKLFYLLAFIIPAAVFVSGHSPDKPFIYNLLNYLVIPFVFLSNQFHDFDIGRILKLFQWFTVLCFAGILLQMAGLRLPFLGLEYAWVNGILQERYGSFAGGTLALGLFSSLSIIYTWYQIIYLKRSSYRYKLILLISLVTLVLANSRRYFVFVSPVVLLIFLMDVNKSFSLKKIARKFFYIFLVLGIGLYGLYAIQDRSLYLIRFFSTFDFVNDGSNAVRVLKWLQAIEQFLDNLWFGAGAGALGTLGKEIDLDNLDTVTVAESYFLKVFVEGGLFFGVFFIGFMFSYARRAFTLFKNERKALAAYIFLFFFLDCFTSMSLEYVLGSMIFWICVSIMMPERDHAV